jgi:hypothetical protein
MVNLIKPWPFVHFDQLFGLTLGQKGHFSQMYWSNVTCVFHTSTFNQNGHTFWLMWTLWSSWPFKKLCFFSFQSLCTSLMFFNNLLITYAMNIKTTKTRISKVHKDKKSKQTMEKISLNSISNVNDEFFKKEHKVCK